MANEITIKDIKDVFIEALEPFAGAIREDFKSVNLRFDKIETDVVDIKKVVAFDIPEMKKDIEEIKETSHALFANFDKYIKLYEDQKQEMLIFGEHLRRLEDRIVKLESELIKK
ncbi:MAG: hypothetical protein Q8L47_00180 [bacterium]|nr:hypothetical protein [bacterium]